MAAKVRNELMDAPTPKAKVDPYQVHDAMRTIAQAEMYKKDRALMREVNKTMAAVSRAAGGKRK